jgi:predicted phage baseplate assembly protein
MPLPLPDLDTRAFADLADEARASVPRWARGWTDHNLSDPGITLTELVAAEVDRLMYTVNRVTERDRRTLLRLLGFGPLPPRTARTLLAFALTGAVPVDLPAGIVLAGRDPDGAPVRYRTLAPVHAGPSAIVAAQVQDGTAFADRTGALAEGEPFAALGPDPDAAREQALLLGLAPAPAPGAEVSLWLALDPGADPDRIETELGAPARAEHHDARVAWEVHHGTGWQPVPHVQDETRALSVSGAVRLRFDSAPPLAVVGAVPEPIAWVRCRVASGRLDAEPRLVGVAINAVPAVQAHAAVTRLVLAMGCVVPAGADPVPGSSQPLAFGLDSDGDVGTLAADPALRTAPVQVLDYAPATAAAEGHLLAELAVLGRGERAPGQRVALPDAPVVAATVAAWVARGTAAEPIRIVASHDASPAHALDAVLDPAAGTLVFGDGRRGRMLAEDELVLASYDATAAGAGNLRPNATFRIAGADDDANRARFGGPPPSDAALAVRAPWASRGGADAEETLQAAGRASRRLFAHERLLELTAPGQPATLDGVDPAAIAGREAPERGMNGPDLERIVLDVPGCRVARARAWPGVDARWPAIEAAGEATIVILPELPAARPEPSPGLLREVRRVVERRRIVGSQILVTGPTWVEVTVRARLKAVVGREPAAVADAARAAIDAYLHPLTGGRVGRGWPFGRDVYRGEILGVLDAAHGVDYVVELELVGPDGETCGNVCVPPTALVAAGAHTIEAEL